MLTKTNYSFQHRTHKSVFRCYLPTTWLLNAYGKIRLAFHSTTERTVFYLPFALSVQAPETDLTLKAILCKAVHTLLQELSLVPKKVLTPYIVSLVQTLEQTSKFLLELSYPTSSNCHNTKCNTYSIPLCNV